MLRRWIDKLMGRKPELTSPVDMMIKGLEIIKEDPTMVEPMLRELRAIKSL